MTGKTRYKVGLSVCANVSFDIFELRFFFFDGRNNISPSGKVSVLSSGSFWVVLGQEVLKWVLSSVKDRHFTKYLALA